MAKTSVVERQLKRQKTFERYQSKREEILKKLQDPNLSNDEKWHLRLGLQKLPRDASPSRLTNRCQITGRAHAVYSRFGLCRIKLRELGMRGEIPGLIRSSW